MTAKELTNVMGDSFIAVGIEGKNISYSGAADKFKGYLENRQVVKVIPADSKSSATIIYTR